MPRSRTSRTVSALALGLFLAGAVAAVAQTAGTDQTAGADQTAGTDQTMGTALAALGQRLSETEASYLASRDHGWAIAAFDALIGDLQALSPPAPEAAPRDRLLARAFFGRAGARFEVDDLLGVDADLERVARAEPGFVPSPGIPEDLAVMFSRVLQDRVGTVELTLEPADARLLVDGREVAPRAGMLTLYHGVHELRAERVGFREHRQTLEVTAGLPQPLTVLLERVSAVLRLQTRPAGVEVRLAERRLGTTEAGEEGGASRPFLIHVPHTGSHLIEARKEGFRSRRSQVRVAELADYDLEVWELERQVGTIRLRGLPAGARLTVDGAAVEPERSGTDGVLRLAPGDYRIAVEQLPAGIFARQLSLADGAELDLEVDFRRPLTLLGILGGDRLGADKLRAALSRAGVELGRWTLLDRPDAGGEALRSAGLDAGALRAAAAAGPRPDWQALAVAAGDLAPGSAYLVVVLDDDLYASNADLWFLPATEVMSPVRPFRRRIDLDDGAAIRASVSDFDHPVPASRSWLGALLIDSAAASGPVVMALTPKGPAAAAGLQPGDEIESVLGQQVRSTAEVEAILNRSAPGFSLRLVVRRLAGQRQLDVRLGSGPVAVRPSDPGVNHVALLVNLSGEGPGDGEVPEWLRLLNRASALMGAGAWEPAVRALKRVQAPAGPGLGQAAVDYWLAKALLAVSPDYAAQARERLEAALAVPGARLFHHDGPLVAPRARALLAELGFRR